ncbi:cupin domain-containing protein [Oxalobacteraceae bacterium A2-2]
MTIIRSRSYTGARAWDALHIATVDGASCRLHWTDQPYRWHVNDGEEVFAVLDGVVDMHYRADGAEQVAELRPGDIFRAGPGCAHLARPRGPARVLVIERAGSV